MKQAILTVLICAFTISVSQAHFAGSLGAGDDPHRIETLAAYGVQTSSLSRLEGAVIVAEDGQFLGKITRNSMDSQSIGNSVGRYGSSVSRTSIFNQVGRYGGTVSRMSPFNSVTSTPPRIYKGDRFIGYLTVNQIKNPRVDPFALIGWIKTN